MGKLRRLVGRGKVCEVCAVVTDGGRCKVENFLQNDLMSSRAVLKKAFALFRRIAEDGVDNLDSSVYEIVRGGVSELKVKGSPAIRFFGFVDPYRGNLLILERGWKKGPRKEQDQQIDAVINFKNNYVPDKWPIE